MVTAKLPTTLIEAVRYFADEDVCRDFLAAQRWPNGVHCVECDSDRVGFIPSRSLWYCKVCGLRFSVKKGTIFEDSPLPLSKWLPAIWLYSAGKKSRSSHQLARDLGVTQKTAWFMGHRIRIALHIDTYDESLSGEVEVDETFVGGKDKNKHADKREHRGRGPIGKVAVMGLLARHGEVRARVVPSRKRRTLHAEIRANVAPGSTVYSDALAWYLGLEDDYVHESSTTPSGTSRGASTPTESRTSGRCSSGSSTGPTTRLSRSISTAISMRQPTASTRVARRIWRGSRMPHGAPPDDA
jgi:transposase-like protein